ncbi:uracil-DNA glycosylase [Agrobacterium sp. a22-2]|uniref:uracil-DNA glycosylase n=1 Tax=Agrobacterium sp. a22-2 TaxID=2283840 RepID=UPI0014463530|nr:uracil-DNA glycosylase [Agrobacterium sp. a22-2]NKN39585.1 uracil-DNA glycosylase [Agrobacterium sp. a22-2]
MISANDLNAAELAALLHFHGDAGVEWLLEEAPVDRVAAFAAEREARQARVPTPAPATAQMPAAAAKHQSASDRPAPRPQAAMPVAIPDEHAVTEARLTAESARSLAELKTAIEGFSACNLKMSARSTIFADGAAAGRIMVIGPIPNGDDDREGLPFSGRPGQLLDRMLSAIGITRADTLLTTVIPWRPPGDRMPSVPESAICRPFIERQIELAEPRAVLLLGNFTARFFFGGNETIHALRGQWREIACGSHTVSAMASLHPQELLTAPATKALAWQDLLAFKSRIAAT